MIFTIDNLLLIIIITEKKSRALLVKKWLVSTSEKNLKIKYTDKKTIKNFKFKIDEDLWAPQKAQKAQKAHYFWK